MSDREILLVISIALLLIFIICQRVRISALYWSVDSFMNDLEEEQRLRATEGVVNKAILDNVIAEKDAEIDKLRNALRGSEQRRKEMCLRQWEENNG